MNEVNALLAENKDFKFVEVVFAPFTGSKTYTYKTLFDLEEGDFVVVDTPAKGLAVVKVVAVKSCFEVDHNVSFQYKWVVQKIDTAAYAQTVAMEEELLAKVNKVKARRRIEETQEQMLSDMSDEDRNAVTKLARL